MSETLSAESEPIKLVIVDQSHDSLDAARDRADQRLDEELGEGGNFKRFLNGIWKGNIAKDYYRSKYTRQADAAIENAQDVLLYEASEAARGRAKEATIERFQGVYDELIHTDAGERREVQGDGSELATGMKSIIKRYCNGELNDETIREERTRLLNAYRESHGTESIGQGKVVVDNLLEVAQAVAGAVEHGESLDNVLSKMQVISGEARDGVRGEARYNAVDRAIDSLSKTKVGSLVGPETVATFVAVAASIARVGSHSVVGAVTKTILPGVAAGLWAGLRENKRVQDERVQHSRETAQGKEYNPGDVRREEMEKTRYESLAAIDLTNHLRMVVGNEQLDDGGNEALQVALDAIAATEARIRLSDSRGINLVTYSSSVVGDERMDLDIARAEAKVALGARLTADARRELGLDESADLREILNQQSNDFIEAIEGDISDKDEAFRQLKNRRVAKAAAIGVASGLTIGLLSQEVMAAVDSTRVGLLEQMWHAHNTTIGGVEHQTVLHGLLAGDQAIENTGASGDYVMQHFGTHGEMSIPKGDTIIDNGNGTFSMADHSGNISAENIAYNPDGSLPQESINQLTKLGMIVNDKSFDTNVETFQTKEVGISEYIDNHMAATTHIMRDMWYDNNTPHKFDLNELRLRWSGASGVTDTGYQLNVASMAPDGSFHGDQAADWSEVVKSGNLKLAVSASVDTQTHVFMVDIGPDGQINIPADSSAGQFFANNGGNAEFHGAYAEVVQTTGVDGNGVEHVRPLATLVGDGSVGTVADRIPVTSIEHHAEYDVIQKYTEMAPVIPIESRRSMEAMKAKSGPEKGYYYRGGSEYMSTKEIIERREETSPRLIENPDEMLVPAQEFAWYKDLLRKKRGEEYVANIEDIVANSPELSSISSGTEVIVKIPVNAAGKAESENIYNVLTKGYGAQDQEALKETVILLHVNWFDDYGNDGDAMRANISHTREEIQRAKADFPSLKIATIETEWKRSEVQNGVIGYVSRKLNDVALLALESATSSGRMDADHDVILIRNDADPKGISPNYLRRFIDRFNNNPETDVFTGTTSFDNTKASRLPGYVFSTNFMQCINTIAVSREGACHTGGANFGVRASTFAAVGAIGFDDGYTNAGSDDLNVGRRVKQARVGAISRNRKKQVSYLYGVYQNHSNNSTSTTKRRIAMRVFGARIDTDSDRGEELYERDIPIIYQWNPEHGFDKDGYKPRNAGVVGGLNESMATDSKKVIERIRINMESIINDIGDSPSTIRTALAFTGLSGRGYNLVPRFGGGYSFEITEEGEKYLKNYLTRDSRGRLDPYGSRKLRQIYGEVSSTAKRQANGRSMIRI